MDDIKKCPFCGGHAELCANDIMRGEARGKCFVFVKCEICRAQGKTFLSNEDPDECNWENRACLSAIKAWNLRTGGD